MELLKALKLLVTGFCAPYGKEKDVLGVLHAMKSFIQIRKPFAPLNDPGSHEENHLCTVTDAEGLARGGLVPGSECREINPIRDTLDTQCVA